MSNLADNVKQFPLGPGVYRFLDAKGKILYIGRATSLRKRVSQYFRKDIDPRIAEMVALARDVRYIETDSVLDAIILEANLIKRHWPKYNMKDKDDRSFLYIVISKKDRYSKPLIVRHRELGKFPTANAYVFGPYQSVTLIKNALRIVRRIFPYSICTPLSGKPCFDHQIGLCPGACIGAITPQAYRANIRNIALLLSGKKTQLLDRLAKAYPETARALRHIRDVSLVTRDELGGGAKGINRIEGYDISHLAGKEPFGSMVVFTDGAPDTDAYRQFSIRTALPGDDLHALEEIIVRRFRHPEWQFPDLVMIDGGKPQVDHIAAVLEREHIVIPMVGISKYAGDALVFPAGTKRSIRDLAQSVRGTLLQVRDEAHRFALRSSRRRRNARIKA